MTLIIVGIIVFVVLTIVTKNKSTTTEPQEETVGVYKDALHKSVQGVKDATQLASTQLKETGTQVKKDVETARKQAELERTVKMFQDDPNALATFLAALAVEKQIEQEQEDEAVA